MSEKTLPENMKSFVAKQILHYLDEDPDKALPNLLSWADKFDKDNLFPSQRAAFHTVIDNPDNNWYRLIKSLWTDLGLQVRYQGRNVNYKDGDFQWTLSDEEMGSFSGNLFQASETESITGTATVTSVHDQAVTATVQLEVGKEPIIAMDFEDPDWKIVTGTTQHGLGDVVGVFDENGNYTTNAAAVSAATQGADAYCLSYTNRNGPTQPKVGNAEIVSLAEGAPVHSGSYSMRMDYDFTQNNNQTDGVCFGLSEDLVLEGNPNKIGLWKEICQGVNMLRTIFRRYAVTNCFEAADIAVLVCSNPQYVYIPPWLFIVRSFEQ